MKRFRNFLVRLFQVGLFFGALSLGFVLCTPYAFLGSSMSLLVAFLALLTLSSD